MRVLSCVAVCFCLTNLVYTRACGGPSGLPWAPREDSQTDIHGRFIRVQYTTKKSKKTKIQQNHLFFLRGKDKWIRSDFYNHKNPSISRNRRLSYICARVDRGLLQLPSFTEGKFVAVWNLLQDFRTLNAVGISCAYANREPVVCRFLFHCFSLGQWQMWHV